jgi:asparagine synthetase A
MTENGRKTSVVEVNGHPITVKKLTDLQGAHLLRYWNILNREKGMDAQGMATERILNIIHSTIVDPMDLELIITEEEAGLIELEQLVEVVRGGDDEEKSEAPAAPKPRRGRPPTKR